MLLSNGGLTIHFFFSFLPDLFITEKSQLNLKLAFVH